MQSYRAHSILLGILIVDRILKYLVIQHSGITLIKTQYFDIAFLYFKNKSLALSIPFPILITILFSIVLIAVLVLYRQKLAPTRHYERLALDALILGATSNLFDRIMYTAVIDYAAISFFGISLPIFNLADILIVMGVLFLIFQQKKLAKE